MLWQVHTVWLILQHFLLPSPSSIFGLGLMLQWHYWDSVGTLCREPPNTLAKTTVVGPSRSTPFGIHKLSPFEVVIGHPMHLAYASFELQLPKGDAHQCCNGLITSIKINHVWHINIFITCSRKMKTLSNKHTVQPKDFIYWKRHLQKDSLQL